MSTDRPLDPVTSIRVKLGVLVAASVLAAVVVASVGDGAGLAGWVTVPVTIGAALGVTQWLARGMTSPLREMTAAARRMAGGDYGQRVTATSSDEVGVLARAFNAMSADLAGADLERRRLVATVSHELRTPLTAQRALLENLADGVVTPDPDTLRGALSQAERLSALVEDLLDLSRVDAGVAPLVLAPVRVEDLLQRTAREASLAGRGVRVDVDVLPRDLTVEADAARLAQLVANLVDNAVRHSPPVGVVRVDAAADGDRWVLEVRDDGPGIPAEEAERVLERFGTGGDGAGGTGLGLAIVRWVCELHGGRVEVVPTAPGATGALVRVTLPTVPRAQRPGHLQEETSMPTTSETPTPARPAPTTPSTPPADASGGGPSDPVVDRFWPEPDGRPRPGVLAAAAGIGALAALTWVDRGIGLVTTLVMLATGALMWRVARHGRDRWTVTCGVLAGLLATTAAVRDAGGVVTLSVLVGVVLAAVGLTRAHGLLAMVASGAAWPLSALRGLPLVGRTAAAASRVPTLVPVLRTAALALVALVVFGGLFATGDAVFGAWAQAVVPDLRWDTIVARTFLFVLVGGVALSGAYLALNPPRVDRLVVPPARPRATYEWAVPVGVVVALFAAFLVAQASALFGGESYLRATTGLTYAEYVHQGFGQMTVATGLTVLVMSAALRVARRSTGRDLLLLRVQLGMLGLFALAVVGSALHRMALYQDAYGFTVLRLWVDGVELWLGLVVLLMLAGLVRMSWSWVPRAVVLSGALFTVGFVGMNPDAWVAGHNIDRYEATGRLDTFYLSGLSADATPTILERLPGDLGTCVVDARRLSTLWGEGDTHGDWLSWNLGRARAMDAAVGPDAEPGLAPDCSDVLTDDYRG
ncbi:DUF4173 domain-containing protein [Phycicoccus sp. BSK3Z-2]|uniref:Signal transduction histidine-protein kinase/phosphatase MprB n=1 Tax=Phycicoccus avicenniae TaxID=2828860 RepID=A0A941I0G4_9MICO|nr:DUF4153 domain-containing protein [Phycicoccus avicenniae]MBR7743211.1 DUF4173 domain-containing protein [Phycicoccus avicenniae]